MATTKPHRRVRFDDPEAETVVIQHKAGQSPEYRLRIWRAPNISEPCPTIVLVTPIPDAKGRVLPPSYVASKLGNFVNRILGYPEVRFLYFEDDAPNYKDPPNLYNVEFEIMFAQKEHPLRRSLGNPKFAKISWTSFEWIIGERVSKEWLDQDHPQGEYDLVEQMRAKERNSGVDDDDEIQPVG